MPQGLFSPTGDDYKEAMGKLPKRAPETRRRTPRKPAYKTFECAVCVVGGGLAGYTAALAMADAGLEVALVAPATGPPDRRTTALLDGSVRFLGRLGIWQALARQAAPIRVQVMIDDSGRLFRAPYTAFIAAEIGLDAFGYNLTNEVLLAELANACRRSGRVRLIEATAASAIFSQSQSSVELTDGSRIDARLVIGADGRASTMRRLAGISARQWSYAQSAMVLNFAHTKPHSDTCYEFHGPNGPFTTVPLGEDCSSLVWVDDPKLIAPQAQASAEALAATIEARTHSVLGKVHIISDRQVFPLSSLVADEMGKPGIVLVGDAGHAIPPIAAQGFNLGLRDIELLAELVAGRSDSELGGTGPLFHRRRLTDVSLRVYSVDLFNRSLLTSALPIQFGRGLALWALHEIGPLRRAAMREGVAPGGEFARLRERLSQMRSAVADRR